MPASAPVLRCESSQGWPVILSHLFPFTSPPPSLPLSLPPSALSYCVPQSTKEDWELTILLLLPGSDFQNQIEIACLPTWQKHCQSEAFDAPRLGLVT